MKRHILYPFAAIATFAAGMAIVVAAGVCIPSLSFAVRCSGQVAVTPPKDVPATSFDRTRESYAVYSAILNSKWNAGNIVLRNETDKGLYQSDEWLEDNVGRPYPELAKDFQKTNEQTVKLENRFDYNGKLTLINEENRRKMIENRDSWKRFKEVYPAATGIVSLSAVGYDAKGTQALVNVSYVCGVLCGEGGFFVLEKKDGKWTVKQEIGAVIS